MVTRSSRSNTKTNHQTMTKKSRRVILTLEIQTMISLAKLKKVRRAMLGGANDCVLADVRVFQSSANVIRKGK